MKVILIDDEKPALDYLEYQLKSISDFEVIGKFMDPLEGKRAIEKQAVDLVFLDIQIPDLNGIELAEQLLEKNPHLPIVFVTAYDEYAIKAFELNAIDYVLKPVSASRLLKTVKRIESEEKTEKKQTANESIRLTLRLFEKLSLIEHLAIGENVIPLKWRTAKAEQLFLYLVQYEGKEVNKDFLVELLWPEFEIEKAYQQLYTAVYNVRKTLKMYRHHFHIKSILDDYVLVLKDVTVDTRQFENFIEKALVLSEHTIHDYERTLAIYSDDFLKAYDYTWAEAIRHRLQLKWIHTALQVTDWYYEQRNFPRALAWAQDIYLRYPLEEEAYFIAMKLNNAMGNFSAVRLQYEKLESILLAELQVAPKPTIKTWYADWLKQREGYFLPPNDQ